METGVSFARISGSPMVDWAKKIGVGSMPRYHAHDAYEICYMIEGRRLFFIRDKTHAVEAGDLVLINIGDIHKTVYADNPVYERVVVNFRPDCLAGMAAGAVTEGLLACFSGGQCIFRLQPEEQAQVHGLLARLHAEKAAGTGESALYRKALMAELLVIIARIARKPRPWDTGNTTTMQAKVQGIVHYINGNYAARLSLEDLSQRFYISRFHLSRLFRQATGFTVVEYLNAVRVREACRLLAGTGETVTAIAEKTGYGSITHFGRTFKAVTGMAPAEYRKKTRGAR